MKKRLPRAERARFQRLPLPTWLRILVITTGWLFVLLGIAGIFLPILQGGICLAIGFALLSIGSQSVHLWLRRMFGRWPGLWRRLEKLRRRIHRKLGPTTMASSAASAAAAVAAAAAHPEATNDDTAANDGSDDTAGVPRPGAPPAA
ncbi:MAG: hypothetical protein R2862_03520 [Thermoanaerobaculia bacterium]